MFVDAHCHLELEEFEEDREKVIERCKKEGLFCIVTVGTEERYFKRVTELCERHDFIYGAIGLHPHRSEEMTDELEEKIRGYLRHKKIVALGEIGLDFYKNYAEKGAQIFSFERQLSIAEKESMPVVIHSRGAERQTIESLSRRELSGVIHCFSYNRDVAKAFLDMGFYISIPGTITYEKNETLRDVVRYLPVDRILTETDAPFLSPEPKRGRRNEPSFVRFTLKKIAELKRMREEDLAIKIKDNLLRVFQRINPHETKSYCS